MAVFRERISFLRRLRNEFGLWGAASVRLLSRVLKRGGTAMPGEVALKIAPQLLADLCRGRRVILVSGTNGKTSTVHMLADILSANDFTVISNRSGANMPSGILTVLTQNMRLLRDTDPKKLILLFEIDEAAFGKVGGDLAAEAIVVTNLFRDQLDRYGELDRARQLIDRGIEASPKAQLILCADDPLTASLGCERRDRTQYFAASEREMEPWSDDFILEANHCLFCGTRYRFTALSYAHLGVFDCPSCGFHRPEPQLTFEDLKLGPDNSEALFTYGGRQKQFTIGIPAKHNVYNASAALLAALALGLDFQTSGAALARSEAAFGRMERIEAGALKLCLILSKNPAGFDQSLAYLSAQPDLGALMFILNAGEQDGRDLSWIWDVNFEKFLADSEFPIAVAGRRAADLVLRLQYAGVSLDRIISDRNPEVILNQLEKSAVDGRTIYCVPNYTAMLSFRETLKKRLSIKDIWE